jgi:hypothetical protein
MAPIVPVGAVRQRDDLTARLARNAGTQSARMYRSNASRSLWIISGGTGTNILSIPPPVWR